ncbi:MAG: hypothetical protein V1797_19905 [Pseudomonadota bacterium]
MSLQPDAQEIQALEAVWRSQAPAGGPALDLTRPEFSAPPRPATADQVAEALRQRLEWPQWVRLYTKPSLAVVAASRLAKARMGAGAVIWSAPGTGAPLEPGCGAPGLVMLRGDWAPGAPAMRLAQTQARDAGLVLAVDESITGLRLHPGGAAAHFGLDPDLALYGPALAGGADFAALAGRGDPPPAPAKAPSAEALAAARGVLAMSAETDIPARLAAWGRALALGLDFFGQKTRVSEHIGWEGPYSLPRLTGKRLWAFRELLAEEGLRLNPLVLFDPGLDPDQAPAVLWPRLCRACNRLKVLPLGEKAPGGWSEAHGAQGLQPLAALTTAPE